MSDKSAIQWTEATWNCIRGCTRVSEGCTRCYAERLAATRLAKTAAYAGLATMTPAGPRWTGKVVFDSAALTRPLGWRKPRMIFVNSMSDLFHESLTDEQLDAMFAVMAMCPQHTFQVLTKRPERMKAYLSALHAGRRQIVNNSAEFRAHGDNETVERMLDQLAAGLSNVWVGVSAEDQATADARIPLLLETPAAVRWVSAEPLLGPVDLTEWLHDSNCVLRTEGVCICCEPREACLDWAVVGGESGPGARSFDLGWARAIVMQCEAAGVPVFVKQLGSQPVYRFNPPLGIEMSTDDLQMRSSKGGDMAEWPPILRVRQMPGRAA